LGKRKQDLWLTDKSAEDSNVTAAKKGRKNTLMKIRGSDIKQVDRFTYLGRMVEKNSNIENEINKGTRKASKSYHLIDSILQNKHKEQN
jgi:uncharacterized protein (UPF0248 family)